MPAVTPLRYYGCMHVHGVRLEAQRKSDYEPLIQLLEYVEWSTRSRIDDIVVTPERVIDATLNRFVSHYTADTIADELETLATELQLDFIDIIVRTNGYAVEKLTRAG